MIEIYQQHPHSCFLYLASILVDEYGKLDTCKGGLIHMLEAFLPTAFKLLETQNGFRNNPDTVDDLFRLTMRFVQKSDDVFFKCSAVRSIIQCGLHAITLDHRDANESVCKFLVEMIDVARNKPGPLVLVEEFSEPMVNQVMQAIVFCLPVSLVRDASGVLFALGKLDVQLLVRCMEKSLQQFPSGTANSTTTAASPEQMHALINAVASAPDLKVLSNHMKDFARLYH